MARLLLEDVTLIKGREEIEVHVRFSGGATRSFTLPRPLSAWEIRQLPHEVVAEIDHLLDRHTDGEVAQLLNERGIASATGRPFDARRIQVIRRAYGLPTREQRLRARGFLSLDQIAARLGLHKETVKRHRREGRLPLRCHRVDDNNRFMYEDPDACQAKDRARSAARPGRAAWPSAAWGGRPPRHPARLASGASTPTGARSVRGRARIPSPKPA